MPDTDHISVPLLVLCLPFGTGVGGSFSEKQLNANRLITNEVLDYGKTCGRQTLRKIPNCVTNLRMLFKELTETMHAIFTIQKIHLTWAAQLVHKRTHNGCRRSYGCMLLFLILLGKSYTYSKMWSVILWSSFFRGKGGYAVEEWSCRGGGCKFHSSQISVRRV